MTTGPDDLTPPIIVFGTTRTDGVPDDHLAVEPSVDSAVNHLFPDGAPDETFPAVGAVECFDSMGRRLRFDTSYGAPTLVAGDERIARGALHARVEEVFARVRAWSYGVPDVFDKAPAGVDHPSQVRPPQLAEAGTAEPTDEAYDTFFAALVDLLATDTDGAARITEDRGSWWHNLFHH